MANIKTWLTDAETRVGETIESIVVGQHYDTDWGVKPLPDEGVILSRDDGMKKLDQDFDDGFGGANCFPMWAWSKSWVFYIDEYDGATSLAAVPRNPAPQLPAF